jgi:hypothetical protein
VKPAAFSISGQEDLIMLDLKFVVEHADEVKKNCAKRNFSP